VQLAIQYHDMGQKPKAMEQMARAGKFAPEFPGVALAMGAVYERFGDLVAAERMYADVIRRTPYDPRALSAMGHLKTQMGDTTAAIDLMNRAIQLDPESDFNPYAELINIYFEKGDYQKAAGFLEAWLKFHPDDQRVRNTLDMLHGNPPPGAGSAAAARQCRGAPDAVGCRPAEPRRSDEDRRLSRLAHWHSWRWGVRHASPQRAVLGRGEFIATAATLGIPTRPAPALRAPDPVGYPAAVRVGGGAGQSLLQPATALAALFTYLVSAARRVLGPDTPEWLAAARVAAFFMAWAPTIWDNAVEAEVYGAAQAILMAALARFRIDAADRLAAALAAPAGPWTRPRGRAPPDPLAHPLRALSGRRHPHGHVPGLPVHLPAGDDAALGAGPARLVLGLGRPLRGGHAGALRRSAVRGGRGGADRSDLHARQHPDHRRSAQPGARRRAVWNLLAVLGPAPR
jgi:tetratricopeptide (TPR) repeat protein